MLIPIELFNIIINYLPTNQIFKFKYLSKRFNYFFNNELILENYVHNYDNRNFILKHMKTLKKIIIYNGGHNLFDEDFRENILDTLILHDNNTLTDNVLKYLYNIKIFHLYINENITNNGLKNLKNIRDLKLVSSSNITDDGLIYMNNIKNISLWSADISDNGLKYIRYAEIIELPESINISDIGIKYLSDNVKYLTIGYIKNINPECIEKLNKIKYVEISY
jgi:hypothetical protein